MAETTTPSASPADNSVWTNALNSLLTTGSNIFSGVVTNRTATANANANARAAAAAAQSNQSSVMKYVLIGGGVLVAVIVMILLLKKK